MSVTDASAATGGTATKAEIQAMQAQMQALAERLNKLEAANSSLQTENRSSGKPSSSAMPRWIT